tara:strand:+ start:200 stop:1390 length:1191 start_codon:yes stop_codon:yes gene_type:complete
MEQKKNNFNKIFLVYIIFLIISSFYLLSKTYLSPTNNSMAEWAINYSGGFGRRGFFGELFTYISTFFDISYRKVILVFLFLIFILYYFLVYFFIISINLNKWIIIAILSPLFLIFPIAELEALGRKDILIPLAFILYIYLTEKLNFKLSILLLVFIYSILLLTHEVSMFYLPFFYLILISKYEKLELKKIIIIIFISILFLLIFYLLSKSIHTEEQLKLLCENLKERLNETCGLGAFMLTRTLGTNFAEMKGFNFQHIPHNLTIFLLGYIFLIFLYINSNFKKNNILSKFMAFKLWGFLIFLPTLIPFIIAVDWGRWYNLSYSMMLVYFLYNFKNNIILFEESNFLKKFNLIFFSSKKKYIIFIFIFCLTWNPKAVYHEDIGSIPIYRAILKIYKY